MQNVITVIRSSIFGVPGDIILGDSTLRVMRPAYDLKEDLGEALFRFNELYGHTFHAERYYLAGYELNYNNSVYATGSAYSLTNTSQLLTFGGISPSFTLGASGIWMIRAFAKIEYNAATFAANQTLTLKLRRTNNTPGDLDNSTTTYTTEILTTITKTMAIVPLHEVIYSTSNIDDVIELWGDINVTPSAGSLDASDAWIVAIRVGA